MFSKDAGVLQGTIELLVLKRLSQGPMHGYGIATWIETATDEVLRVEEAFEWLGPDGTMGDKALIILPSVVALMFTGSPPYNRPAE